MALLYLLLFLLTAGVGIAVGYAIAIRRNNKAALSKQQRIELENLRQMTDELLQEALDRAETDTFAMVVFDSIRKYQRGVEQ